METTKKTLRDKMLSLIDEKGSVYVWSNADGMPPIPRRFSTEENARECVGLKNELKRFLDMPEFSYVIGTEEEYQKAQRDFLKLQRAKQVKDYSAHVDELVKIKQHEIKALNALQEVCQKFDGKVINKRFTCAVSEASGLRVSFAEYYECVLDMQYFGHDYSYELKPYVRIFGSKTEERSGTGRLFWRWGVGDRLEAGKVADIIAPYINDRLKRIDELKATKKQYYAYVKLAEKAAKLVKELNEYDNTLQMWARDHKGTEPCVHASRVWRS